MSRITVARRKLLDWSGGRMPRMRKVLIEPLWKLHSLHRAMVESPPESYEFVTAGGLPERAAQVAGRHRWSYGVQHLIERAVPLNLAVSYARSRTKHAEVDLTYAHSHLVFRREPWVADIEYVNLFVSPDPQHFRRHERLVNRVLASPYCRRVICETHAGERSVLCNLDCDAVRDKVTTLHAGVRPREFDKAFDLTKTKILFVGSGNILGEFEMKGGREALECFVLLQLRYSDLELVIRSDVPQEIRRKYRGWPGIVFIEKRISTAALEREFMSADIFLLPAHNTPFLAFLDAMAFELPVVTIDAWANSEFIEDGKNGLLAPKSESIPYVTDSFLPCFGTPRFSSAIEQSDPLVVGQLVRKASALIESAELRRGMGRAGRWEVEQGKFSLRERNRKLKRILDDAIGTSSPS